MQHVRAGTSFALRRERVEGRGSNLSLLKRSERGRGKKREREREGGKHAGCAAPFTAGYPI